MIPVFQQIIGHQNLLERFQQQIETDRFPVTLLFYGREGIGKKLMATCITAALFCPKKGCGKCSVCRRVLSFQHPDFYYLAPEKGKRGIPIDAIRLLQQKIHLKPFEAGQKLILIEEADSMSTEAANSFLKTLEEPPVRTRIVLLSEQKYAFLPTILSRVQSIRCQSLLPSEMKIFLNTHLKTSRTDFLLALAQGSPGKALLLAETDLEQIRQNLCTWLRRYEEQDTQKFVEKFLSFPPKELPTKEDLRKYLAKQTEVLLLLFRDLSIIPYAIPIINRDQASLLQLLSRKIFSELAQVVIQELYEYLKLLERNINIELATEAVFARIHHLLKRT